MNGSNMNPQSILDTSKPLNVELFDQIVKSFYSGSSNRQVLIIHNPHNIPLFDDTYNE